MLCWLAHKRWHMQVANLEVLPQEFGARGKGADAGPLAACNAALLDAIP